MTTTGQFNLNTMVFTNTGTNLVTATVANGTMTFSSDNVTITPNNLVQLKGVSDPTAAQDAATKAYVDSITTAGITWKDACRLASTTNIVSLSGLISIDSTSTADGDRILIKDQSTTTENGIYVASTGAWSRATDAVAGTSANGAAVFVYDGSANNDTSWVVTNDSAVDWDGGVTFTLLAKAPVAAGSSGDVQYNDGSGGLAAEAAFNYTAGSDTLTLGTEGATSNLTAPDSGTATVAGGALNITSGGGNTTGSGGTITITAGTGGASSGAGGSVVITGGAGGATDGSGGSASLTGGDADGTQTGGTATLAGGGGGDGATGNGGAVNVTGGDSNATNGSGGAITVTTGSATGTGSTGDLTLSTSDSTTTSGSNPGDINITGGDAGSGSGADGAIITITAGTGDGGGANGNVLIPTSTASTSTTTGSLVVTGGAGFSLDVYANKFKSSSDKNIKTNIKQLTNQLEVIKKLKGYSYDYKPEYPGYMGPNQPIQYGVIAQQLEEAGLDNLVSGVGQKAVDYNGLIPILIESTKELSEEIEQLKFWNKMMTLGLGVLFAINLIK